jgi:hypothetical protein
MEQVDDRRFSSRLTTGRAAALSRYPAARAQLDSGCGACVGTDPDFCTGLGKASKAPKAASPKDTDTKHQAALAEHASRLQPALRACLCVELTFSPMNMGVSSYLVDSVLLGGLGGFRSSGAGGSPAASHFSFASPKEK